jgi:hypothetical protein
MKGSSKSTEAKVSNSAVASVAAALAHGNRGRTEEEKAFDVLLTKCVWKEGRHKKQPLPKHFRKVRRLYTVTTITSSQRFGGVRTPAICTTFKLARDFVERNAGDLFECSYSLAVIEAVAADTLYTYLDEVYWYMWEPSEDPEYTGRYREIEVPPGFEGRGMQPIG